MSAKKVAASKGKRYSEAEKAEILAFIDAQGRGGQSKASKKFGVSPLTLSSWRKKSGGSGNGKASTPVKGLDLEIATAKWLGKQGFDYEIFQSLSSGSIERKTGKGIEALALFSGGDYAVARIGKGGEPIIELSLSKLIELTKTKA
ncbi:transposase [Luteolibacter arcticus]|uniref:Transposase n=1 Tax=Luteolibacter arcticus TaxID=1581411 RepID=A0ABT3GDK2_9BACT|nr:transposase [Luteolibacter arcticus]MCW1921084.1 transposase [Luteolibacter arcticus]